LPVSWKIIVFKETLSGDEEDDNDDSQSECSSTDTEEDNQMDESQSILDTSTSLAVF